jgi:hypothetical protein
MPKRKRTCKNAYVGVARPDDRIGVTEDGELVLAGESNGNKWTLIPESSNSRRGHVISLLRANYGSQYVGPLRWQ